MPCSFTSYCIICYPSLFCYILQGIFILCKFKFCEYSNDETHEVFFLCELWLDGYNWQAIKNDLATRYSNFARAHVLSLVNVLNLQVLINMHVLLQVKRCDTEGIWSFRKEIKAFLQTAIQSRLLEIRTFFSVSKPPCLHWEHGLGAYNGKESKQCTRGEICERWRRVDSKNIY